MSNSCFCLKVLSHWLQAKGFSPVCVRRCITMCRSWKHNQTQIEVFRCAQYTSTNRFKWSGLTNLATAIVTQVTFEPLFIFMRLLMLNQGIALMKHSITVATLFSCLNEWVLLTKMDTCDHKTCSNYTIFSIALGLLASCTKLTTVHIVCVGRSNIPKSLFRAITVSQWGQWNLATFSVCFCRMCIFMVPLWVKRAWQI